MGVVKIPVTFIGLLEIVKTSNPTEKQEKYKQISEKGIKHPLIYKETDTFITNKKK